MSFVDAVKNTPEISRTWNGMKAFKSSLNNNVDLFYSIGASRGRDVSRPFELAFKEDRETALRVLQWARDVRGGAGERQIYRNMLKFLEKNYKDEILGTRILENTAEIGRWDDLLIFEDAEVKEKAFGLIKEALDAGNGLAAKWMPRKGTLAAELRNAFGWSPKFYRKRLVELTKVVESAMCSGDWDSIEYSKVPSLAMSRYTKAFGRHSPEAFDAYIKALQSGDPDVKVNAGAIYPYDVLKTVFNGNAELADEQWKALPNFMGDANVLPLVDVSGSMTCRAGNGQLDMTCLHVALSLGLYCSDKNEGAYKDLMLTFSGNPQWVHVKGTLSQKYRQMEKSNWSMNTDLHKALEKILDVAVKNKVPEVDMPNALLILSDMQFDYCCKHDDRAMEMIRRKYEDAGYRTPGIVFWNLNDAGNTPVRFDERGTALVSGFSPSVMKAVLACDFENMTPEAIMKKAVNIERYDIFS